MRRRIPKLAIAAALVLATAGGLTLRRWLEPRTLSVCVVSDYSFRNAHPDWRQVLESRFDSVRRAFRGTGIAWNFRDADQPDPTARLEGGIEERRQKLIRTECEADIVLGVTGLPGARGDVPPFAHTAVVADSGAHAWVQSLAALFGVPPADVPGEDLPASARARVRRLRDYDFAHATESLEGPWGDRVYDALAASVPPAEAHRLIAFSLAADGRFPGAIRRLQARARLDPENPAAHIDLANAYIHNFDPLPAIDEYRAAVRLQPDSPAAHTALGVADGNAGLAEDALDEFRTALRLDPKFLPAHSGMAYVLTQQPGRIGDAIFAYESALQLDPNYAPAAEGLGRARGLRSRAAADAAELRRRNPVPRFDLGLAEARAGNLDAGIAELRRAVDDAPSNTLAHQQLALLLYRLGDRPAARQQAQLAAAGGMDVPRDVAARLQSP